MTQPSPRPSPRARMTGSRQQGAERRRAHGLQITGSECPVVAPGGVCSLASPDQSVYTPDAVAPDYNLRDGYAGPTGNTARAGCLQGVEPRGTEGHQFDGGGQERRRIRKTPALSVRLAHGQNPTSLHWQQSWHVHTSSQTRGLCRAMSAPSSADSCAHAGDAGARVAGVDAGSCHAARTALWSHYTRGWHA